MSGGSAEAQQAGRLLRCYVMGRALNLVTKGTNLWSTFTKAQRMGKRNMGPNLGIHDEVELDGREEGRGSVGAESDLGSVNGGVYNDEDEDDEDGRPGEFFREL